MIQRKPQEAYSEFCPFFTLKRELPAALVQAFNAGDETHYAQDGRSVADVPSAAVSDWCQFHFPESWLSTAVAAFDLRNSLLSKHYKRHNTEQRQSTEDWQQANHN